MNQRYIEKATDYEVSVSKGLQTLTGYQSAYIRRKSVILTLNGDSPSFSKMKRQF
jgi:hypothetical protein